MEIVQMVPKINQYFKSVKSDNLVFKKEKKFRKVNDDIFIVLSYDHMIYYISTYFRL
jgi:hypothetical protein